MAKLTESTVQRAFFFALLFAVTLAFIWLIRGFLQPIFWAVASIPGIAPSCADSRDDRRWPQC